jgi:trk system potassium uptake protein
MSFGFQPIVFIVGIFITALGVVMGVPAIADIVTDNRDWLAFAVSGGSGLICGTLMILSSYRAQITLSIHQAFFLTTSAWIGASAFGALPFFFSELDISYTDAFFEAVSGLTTTGSTVLTGLDGMPAGILLWRSILQWVGGIGIIVMAVAILPYLRVGGMQLFRTESSDRSEKVLPGAAQIAAAIGRVYLLLTVLCIFAYWMCGMTVFEAVNHAMTTLSTGGYSTFDASLGHFQQPAIHWFATLFMLAGGLPFVLYIQAISRRNALFVFDSQVCVLLVFLMAVTGVLSVWLSVSQGYDFLVALRLVAFNVVSVVTTTGFATTDYTTWGPAAVMFFFLLTYIGGCTGSTSGGIKVFRFQVMYAAAQMQFRRLVHPHAVYIPRYHGHPLPEEVITSVATFVLLFLSSAVFLSVALGCLGLDFVTAVSGAATALANVGPGLGATIGPAGNFASLPDAAKWLLSAGMLLGRLEILTCLILFMPSFWR